MYRYRRHIGFVIRFHFQETGDQEVHNWSAFRLTDFRI